MSYHNKKDGLKLGDFFEGNKKIISQKSLSDLTASAESDKYIGSKIKSRERFVPSLDYNKPENFAKFGSAKRYYEDSIKRVADTYPYDGSKYEQEEWYLSSSNLDLYFFETQYPKTTGYLEISTNGWTLDGSKQNGYGKPQASQIQNVSFVGGPLVGDVYDISKNRATSLRLNPSQGNTIEFWLKKDATQSSAKTETEVFLDIFSSNAIPADAAGTTDLSSGRLRIESHYSTTNPFQIKYMSGSTSHNIGISVGPTAAEVYDGNWHHHAFVIKENNSKLNIKHYFDGVLHFEDETLSTLGEVKRNMVGRIGCLATSVGEGNSSGVGYGQLSGALDDFRFWNTARTTKEIGRFYRDSVNGGTDLNPTNTDLGLYYKFNEGITSTASVDSVVLDYSGRVKNGTINGYSENMRFTGSAINSFTGSADFTERADPILYTFHPDVVALNEKYAKIGEDHDATNSSFLLNTFPSWMVEEDAEINTLGELTQIMSSVFDDMFSFIHNLSKLKNNEYFRPGLTEDFTKIFAPISQQNSTFLECDDESNVPEFGNFLNDLARRNVSHVGVVSEILDNSEVFEYFFDRAEDRTYGTDPHTSDVLQNVKLTIAQSIYNNYHYISSTKGTEKSFRNLIRCFGVDDELIKLNVYANNLESEIKENKVYSTLKTKALDFSHPDNHSATLYHTASGVDSNSWELRAAKNFVTGALSDNSGLSLTAEADVFFPKKFEPSHELFVNTPFTGSSVFGFKEVDDAGDDLSAYSDTSPVVDINVEVKRINETSKHGSLILSSDNLGISDIESPVIYNLYDNNRWNISFRIQPKSKELYGILSGSAALGYELKFYGYNYNLDTLSKSFELSSDISSTVANNVLRANKRFYLGAKRENFSGAVQKQSDIAISNFSLWQSKLSDEDLKLRAQNPAIKGAREPQREIPLYTSDYRSHSPTLKDSKILNWEFNSVSNANSDGTLLITDLVSGSLERVNQLGNYGEIVGYNYPAKGQYFNKAEKAIRQQFYPVVEFASIDNEHTSDRIEIRDLDRTKFKTDSRPITRYYSFEKSMYQAINKEIVFFLGTLLNFNNLIGETIYKYRQKYKPLEKLREKFFSNVNSDIDLDRFVEYYKFIDNSLASMLDQITPLSSRFSKDIKNMVESHALERNKYQHKYPTIESKQVDPTGPMLGIEELMYTWGDGHRFSPKSGRAPLPVAAAVIEVTSTDHSDARNKTLILEDASGKTHTFKGCPPSDCSFRGGQSSAHQSIRNADSHFFHFGANETNTAIMLVKRINEIYKLAFDPNHNIVPEANRIKVRAKLLDPGHRAKATIKLPQRTMGFSAFKNALHSKTFTLVDSAGTSQVFTFSTANNTLTGGAIGISSASNIKEVAQNIITAINNISGLKITANLNARPQPAVDETNPVQPEPEQVAHEIDIFQDERKVLTSTQRQIIGDVTSIFEVEISSFADDSTPKVLLIMDDINGVGKNITGTLLSSNHIGGDTTFIRKHLENDSASRLWWETRAERDKDVMSHEVSSTLSQRREELRIARNTVVSGSNFILRNRTKPYKISATYEIQDRISGGGTSQTPAQNIFHGEVGDNLEIHASDSVANRICDQDKFETPEAQGLQIPQHVFDALCGSRDDVSVEETKSPTRTIKASKSLPFKLYDNGLFQNHGFAHPTLEITNNHDDSYGPRKEVPMQGPFTQHHVGGNFHRHNEITQSDSDHRVEAYKINITTESMKVQGVDKGEGEIFGTHQPLVTTRRDIGLKSPVNIKNIKSQQIEAKVLGNFTKDYEVISITGRLQNNRDQLKSGSYNFDVKDNGFVDGFVDKKTPVRSRSEHIIISKFSAPGSTEGTSVYTSDEETEEFSVYNTINYRNLAVRRALDILHTEPSNQFGARSGSVINSSDYEYQNSQTVAAAIRTGVGASPHKQNRNTTFINGELKKDNFFVQHQIPRNDMQYSWITASALDNIETYPGYQTQVNILTGSAYITKRDINYLTKSETNDEVSFVGLATLNSGQYLMVTSSTNTVSFNIHETPDVLHDLENVGALNKAVLSNQGPYGWPSWKQIRGGESPIIREHRKNNTVSIVRRGNQFNVSSLSNYEQVNLSRKSLETKNDTSIFTKNRKIKNYKEVCVTNRFKNLKLIMRPETYRATLGHGRRGTLDQLVEEFLWDYSKNDILSVPTKDPGIFINVSYGNSLTTFANEEIIKDLNIKEIRSHSFDQMINSGIPDTSGTKLSYAETIYPREINTFTKAARQRENFNFYGWNSDQASRETILADANTYSAYTNGSIFRKISADTNSPSNTNSLFVDTVDYDSVGNIIQLTQSTWPLDSRRNYSSSPLPLNITASYTSVEEGQTEFLDNRGQGTRGEGELQNDYSIFGMGYNLVHGTPPPALLYNRRIPQKIDDNTYLAGEAKWEAGDQSGINPTPDSYTDFSENLKGLGQDYSIIPEFKISDHIESIINSNSDFKDPLENFLSLTGSSHDPLVDQESFYKTYSTTDFLKYFKVVDETLSNSNSNLDLSQLTLKCKGVLKFLPYRGFYPVERTTQIGSIFGREYLKGITDVVTSDGSDVSQFIDKKISGSLQQAIKPMMAPGILYNSIKAGMPVDYPIFVNEGTGSIHQTTTIPTSSLQLANLINVEFATTTLTVSGNPSHIQTFSITGSLGDHAEFIFDTTSNLTDGQHAVSPYEEKIIIGINSAVGNNTTIATRIATTINNQTEVAVTALASSNTVLLTQDVAGLGGNVDLDMSGVTNVAAANGAFTGGTSGLGGVTGSIFNGTSDESIPRLSGSVSKRVTFEELLDPSALVREKTILYDNEPHPSASMLYGGQKWYQTFDYPFKFGTINEDHGKRTLGITDFVDFKDFSSYRLAVNNFVAETENFFLEKEGVSYLESSEVDFEAAQNESYKMRLYVENPGIVMYDRHSAFGPPVDGGSVQKSVVQKVVQTGVASSATAILNFSSGFFVPVGQTSDDMPGFEIQGTTTGSVSVQYYRDDQLTGSLSAAFVTFNSSYTSPTTTTAADLPGFTFRQLTLGAATSGSAKPVVEGDTKEVKYYNSNVFSANPTITILDESGGDSGTVDGGGGTIANKTITINDGSSTRTVTFKNGASNASHVAVDGGPNPSTVATRLAAAINDTTVGTAVNATAVASSNVVTVTHDSGGTVTLVEPVDTANVVIGAGAPSDTDDVKYIDIGSSGNLSSTQLADVTRTAVRNLGGFLVSRFGSTLRLIPSGSTAGSYIRADYGGQLSGSGNASNTGGSFYSNISLNLSSSFNFGRNSFAAPEDSGDNFFVDITGITSAAQVADKTKDVINRADGSFSASTIGAQLTITQDATGTAGNKDILHIEATTGQSGYPDSKLFFGNIVQETSAAFTGGSANTTDTFFTTTTETEKDHGFMPFVPPYLDPGAKPYIEFTLTPSAAKRYSLDDVFNEVSVEYYNFKEAPSNPDDNTDYKRSMALTASLNVRQQYFDPLVEDGKAILPTADDLKFKKKWVISTKWETPILDFNGKPITAYDPDAGSTVTTTKSDWKTRFWTNYFKKEQSDNRYLTSSRGMWHQYGDYSDYKSYKMYVSDVTGHKSLASVVGFNSGDAAEKSSILKEPTLIGRVKKEKQISEGVVAVPYYVGQDGRVKFFEILEETYKNSIETENSPISHQISMMNKFVLPPQFDWVKYPDKKKIAMYIFEFKAKFDKQDLINIWQNLSPTSKDSMASPQHSSVIEKTKELRDTQYVSHSLDLNSGESLIGENFFRNKVRWMVFKVKQKSKRDYNKMLIDSLLKDKDYYDLLSEDLKHSLTGIAKSGLEKYDYCYNWPYDFFSIVELIKLETKVDFENTTEEQTTE